MKVSVPIVVVLLIAVGLFASNPDEDKMARWAMNYVRSEMDKGAKPKSDAEAAGEKLGWAIAESLGPALIKSMIVRNDCLLFSLFSGRDEADGAVVLGIAGKFIPIKSAKNSDMKSLLTSAKGQEPEAEPELELKPGWDFSWTEHGSARITGKVVNKSGRTLDFASIKFSLRDKSDCQVGTALDNISNLEAGATWAFEAYVPDPDKVERARHIELTGH